MHCKCSSSPAQSTSIKARITALDGLPKEDKLTSLEGINGRSRELCSKSRSNDELGYGDSDWASSYYDKREVSSASRALHVGTIKRPQTDVSGENFPSFLYVKSLHCAVEEEATSLIEGKEGKYGLASESSNSALLSRKCSIDLKISTDGANSTICSPSYHVGEHKHNRVGCRSTPYEADIGVDMLSLQLRKGSLSPHEKTKVARVEYTNERSFSFQTSSTLKPKLDTQGSTAHLHGLASKRPAEQRTFVDPAIFGGRRNVALPNGFFNREASMVNRKPPTTPPFNRPLYAILHPRDHTQRDPKDILLHPWSTKHYSYNEILKPAPCDEKADAFTMHSPLLMKEPRYLEKSSVNARGVTPPMVPVTSRVQWDWRSKSMGAKASLKSAIRNLEATFASSRSVSLPKTRPCAKPKDSKPESTKLLERVFVSPIRARSKPANFLEPIEKPLLPSRESNGINYHKAFWRKDAKISSPNVRILHMGTGAPGKLAIRPLPPSSCKDADQVTWKPFLPASKSVRCLPASRGAFGIESLGFSARKADGFSSSKNALDPASMLHAQLQCFLKDGLPFYTMVIEGSDEVLFARACWQENHSSKEGFKWQYSFHSGGQGKARGTGGSGGWRNWIKKESKAISGLSGVMEVHRTHCHESAVSLRDQQFLKVLEFVLYDGKEAGVSHSQSSRFSSMERRCQKSVLSREGPSSLSSELVLSSSPSHLDMDMAHWRHSRSLTELTESLESASTTSGLQKGNGGHRPSVSLDVCSDSGLPDSVQVPSSCLTSPVELAALVIQVVAAESHQEDFNVSESNHICQNSEGCLEFIGGGSRSELKSPHAHSSEKGVYVLGQAELGTFAERSPSKRSGHFCAKTDRDKFLNEGASAIEKFPASPTRERSGMEEGSVNKVTLLLPTGDHGFPTGGRTRGPSSLIDRWRSGGSCECGGWDLGCGIKVIRSKSPSKECGTPKNKHPILCDQRLSLFVQGSKQELMLGLSLVKQGECRLSFQEQLTPLKAFATAVAMLHSHEPTFLSVASTPASSLSSSSFIATTPSSLSVMSASAVENESVTYGLRENLPPCPTESLHLAAPRRSDSSSKDKISLFLVHNQTFSN